MFNMMKKGILNTNNVKVMVLDEADAMLNQESQMGRDVSQCRRHLPTKLQVLFFSATYPDDVRNFAISIVPSAAKITVSETSRSQSCPARRRLRYH
jgi:ATP-dependent RNA helicase DDX19/DBP5